VGAGGAGGAGGVAHKESTVECLMKIHWAKGEGNISRR
jgi:hypothetical protein